MVNAIAVSLISLVFAVACVVAWVRPDIWSAGAVVYFGACVVDVVRSPR